MKVAVGIATAGRPEYVTEVLSELTRQSRLPDEVVICPASESDVHTDHFTALNYLARCVSGSKGLPSQRNAILRALEDYDLVVFLDDDYFPARDFLAEIERLFLHRTDVVVARGTLIADGINGPGIPVDQARHLIAASLQPAAEEVKSTYGAYGCQFAARLDTVRQHGVWFDENLPLYGWQEDIDFSRQMARYGAIVISNRMRGVHMGVKRGRTSGLRFGYSQIANPLYLVRKGTMSAGFGARLIMRNFAANAIRSVSPEPYVDRVGRLKGNCLAVSDLLCGKLHPTRILDLP